MCNTIQARRSNRDKMELSWHEAGTSCRREDASREVGDELTELSSSTCAAGRLVTSCRREADKSWSSPSRPAQPGGWRRPKSCRREESWSSPRQPAQPTGWGRAAGAASRAAGQEVGDELLARWRAQLRLSSSTCAAGRLGVGTSCRQRRLADQGRCRRELISREKRQRQICIHRGIELQCVQAPRS